MSNGSQMHDMSRRSLGDGPLHALGVADIALQGLVCMLGQWGFCSYQCYYVMPGLLQDLAQNLPNETVGACDENALHGRSFLKCIGASGRV